MEGKLERKIGIDVSEKNKVLGIIGKTVNNLYPKIHTELIDIYISDQNDIKRWYNLIPQERVENLPYFLDLFRGRWVADLANYFCPIIFNKKMAENVVLEIIKKAVREGELESEIANNESKYRCSVGSFLVGEDTVERLGKDHFVLYDSERRIYYPTKEGRILLAIRGGYACMEKSKGIHGLSKEQRVLNGRKGGKKSGAITLQNKLGIHAQTIEEKRNFARMAVEAKGFVLWNKEAIDYLISLVANPNYKYPEGHNHSGLPNWQKITEELNSKYEMNRTVEAVSLKYSKVIRQ